MVRLRELREASNMTQKDLGKVLSVRNTAVSQYESGTRQLDPDKICALCDLFHVSADYLLGRSDTPLPVISDEDARLLAAYHAAPENVREAILALLRPEQVSGKQVS